MNKTTDTNWANTEHYEKLHAHFTENGIDASEPYYYVRALEDKGFVVYHQDLKGWLKSLDKDLKLGDLEL